MRDGNVLEAQDAVNRRVFLGNAAGVVGWAALAGLVPRRGVASTGGIHHLPRLQGLQSTTILPVSPHGRQYLAS